MKAKLEKMLGENKGKLLICDYRLVTLNLLKNNESKLAAFYQTVIFCV